VPLPVLRSTITAPDDTLSEATGNKARLARVNAEALLASASPDRG
jgi:hypothetical protein